MTVLDRAEVVIGGNDTPLGNTLARASKRMQAAGQKMTRMGRTLTARVTAPIAAAGAAALKMSSDFEKSMTQLQTLVGLSADEVQGLRTEILDLAPAVGSTPQELSKAMFAITSAGLRGAEAMAVLEQSAKASAIGLGDVSEIGRTATAALNAFGDSGLTAEKAIDTLVTTVRTGNLRADELAGSLGRVIGIADAAGVSFEQMNAFIATFTRLGAPAEVAATSLRSVLSSMMKPTTETREAFQQLGTTVGEFRQEIQERGLAAAMIDLIDSADGNVEVISALIPNVRALAGVLGTAGSQSEEFLAVQREIEESLGATNEGFEEIQGTTAQTFDQLKAQASAMAITFGDEMAPAFSEVLNGLREIMDAFTDLPGPVKKTMIVVGGLAAALGPLLIVAGQLVTVVSGLAGGMALLGGPITAVVAGATALVGIGVVTALKNWAEAGADARAELDLLRGSLSELNEDAENMTRMEIARTISSLRLRAENVRRQIEEIRSDIKQRGRARGIVGVQQGFQRLFQGDEQARELEALEQQQDELNQSMQRLTEQGRLLSAQNEETAGSTGEVTSAVTRSADAVGELISGLQNELDQLRFTERELLKRELALEGATAAERKQALALFDKVEALRGAQEAMRQFRETTSGATRAAAGFANSLVGLPAMLQHVSEEARNFFDRTSDLTRQMQRVREANERIKEQARERVDRLVSQVRLEKMREDMRLLNDMADRMAKGFVSAFEEIGRGSKSVVEAIGEMVTNIIAEFARLQAQKMFAKFFSGLMGSGIPDAPSGEIDFEPPDLPGMQHGGRFQVAGAGGTDSQLVRFMATPGETVTVDPSRGGSGGVREARTPSPQVNVTVQAVDSKSFNRQFLESGAFGQTVRASVEQAIKAPTKRDSVRRTMVTGR